MSNHSVKSGRRGGLLAHPRVTKCLYDKSMHREHVLSQTSPDPFSRLLEAPQLAAMARVQCSEVTWRPCSREAVMIHTTGRPSDACKHSLAWTVHQRGIKEGVYARAMMSHLSSTVRPDRARPTRYFPRLPHLRPFLASLNEALLSLRLREAPSQSWTSPRPHPINLAEPFVARAQDLYECCSEL